jgi:type VI protein secretion system component Hcp
MAEDSRDVLMKLEMTPGKSLPAECTAVISAEDPMARGFRGTNTAGNLIRGNYFSIEDFTFDAGISDRGGADPDAQQAQNTRNQVNSVAQQVNRSFAATHNLIANAHSLIATLEQRVAQLESIIAGMPAGRGLSVGRNGGRTGGAGGFGNAGDAGRYEVKGGSGAETNAFNRFLTEGRNFLKREKRSYHSDLEPISITKRMDLSSPTLFDSMRNSFKFHAATIIRRKAIGGQMLRTYLRIDFGDVMITELNWDDDDVIKETFKFVCRSASVRYAIETPSTDPGRRGSAVLTPLEEVYWEFRDPTAGH